VWIAGRSAVTICTVCTVRDVTFNLCNQLFNYKIVRVFLLSVYTFVTDTVLQIGRSLVRFQMVSLAFSIDIFLPIALWPWGRLRL
jgi:hypothetical protein